MSKLERRISQKRITKARTVADRYFGHQIKISEEIETLEKEIDSLKNKPSFSSKFLVQSKELKLKDLQQKLEAAQYKCQQQVGKVQAAVKRNNSLNNGFTK